MGERRVQVIPSVTAAELRDALNKGGSVSEAAAILGVHRATVYRLMKLYKLEMRRIVA